MINLKWMQRAISGYVGCPRSPNDTMVSMESTYNIQNIYKGQTSRKVISIEGLIKQSLVNPVTRGSDNVGES
jgi:hypothetical protein